MYKGAGEPQGYLRRTQLCDKGGSAIWDMVDNPSVCNVGSQANDPISELLRTSI